MIHKKTLIPQRLRTIQGSFATIEQEFKTKAAPEQAFLNEVHMLCVMNA